MMDLLATALKENARGVISKASVSGFLLASAQQTANYASVWARDSAVTILAILATGITESYADALNSLKLLRQAAHENGQIPSNVGIGKAGETGRVSFGGTAGRTDAGFWWLIAGFTYLKKVEDPSFRADLHTQAVKIFALAEAWEFNGRHLMYVPMSGNWADEYLTHGYVLYDQLLRYWALLLAADDTGEKRYAAKAAAIKTAIKQHYLFEQPLTGSLYPLAQQQAISGYRLDENFIASFSPGDRVERFDGWSIALLLLLKIPSAESQLLLSGLIERTFTQYGAKGIPAFWPEIKRDEAAFNTLQNNYSYHFKNEPGHFHNGGIWPVVNGFLIVALNLSGEQKIANTLIHALSDNLNHAEEINSFAEYFGLYDGQPNGTKDLCFSAAGYLLAEASASDVVTVASLLPENLQRGFRIQEQYVHLAEKIMALLPPATDHVLVISIAGESGCGKTTLSDALRRVLESVGRRTILLHQDDYFKLPPRQNHLARERDLDHVGYSEVRLKELDEDIRSLTQQNTGTLNLPRMNWLKDEEETFPVTIGNISAVLVEGTYTSLLTEPHFRIFFDSDYQQTRENRRNRARDAESDFIERVLAKESSLIKIHRNLADLVIDRNLNLTWDLNIDHNP